MADQDSTLLGPNPSGFCMCGCGQRTALAPQTHAGKGWVAGQPVRFMPGHNSTSTGPVRPNVGGVCQCGCGAKTPIAKYSSRIRGTVKGQPTKYLVGHSRKERHGRHLTPTYRTWAMMKSRCFNSKSTGWEYYGGRGITVYEGWLSFEGFLASMGDRPEGTSLDRINPNGDYEPGNCRWATAQQQRQNMRPRRKRES